MLLAGKAAWAGIVFLLLTTGRSGPLPTPLASGANLSKEVPAVTHPDDVKKVQETLKGKGHYRGEVDGVFGLRTRASVRGFQKTENLPVTGQLDAQTAVKLGVRPEGREEVGYETTQGKPSRAEHRSAVDRGVPTSPCRCSWRIPSQCAKLPLPSSHLPRLSPLC